MQKQQLVTYTAPKSYFSALQVKLRALLGQQIIFGIISYIQFDNRSYLQCLQNVVYKASFVVIIKVRISFSTVQELLDSLNRSSCPEVELYIGLGAMTQVIGCHIAQSGFGCLELIFVSQQINPLKVTKWDPC